MNQFPRKRRNEMARQAVRTDAAPTPVASYSQAVRIGAIIAVAGQGGFDPATGALAADDVGGQTAQTFKNIAACLDACGVTLDDVIRVDVYLADMTDFPAMNEEYAKVFTSPYPARTTVGVTLPPGMKVEITAFAVEG
jgi:2-iminobutanoate/2-iminopropanoate deaminase